MQSSLMETLEELERRAETGGPEARFALGMGLLAGADADLHLERGLGLIEGASADGHAPATEMCSIFEAMGVARPQDWDRAFDRLRLAAEQGSRSAQTQLLLLADPDRDPAVPKSAPADRWAEIRQTISLDQLVRHPERISLSEAPRIRVIEGFLTPPESRWLIERARGRLQRASIIDTTGAHRLDPGRSNTGTEFLVLDMDVVLEIVRTRISAATRLPVPVFEPTQILHYAVGEEFKPHHDFLDPINPAQRENLQHGQRIATFLVYLNEEFEGGETQFPAAGIGYRGKTGDAIFFANVDMEGHPDPLTLHAGCAPTSGEKWILSQWIRDRVAPPR